MVKKIAWVRESSVSARFILCCMIRRRGIAGGVNGPVFENYDLVDTEDRERAGDGAGEVGF